MTIHLDALLPTHL